MLTANELRNKYLEFFKSKGHAIIPSASLIPENDPTVLFTTAGMHPLVPYLMGEGHPQGTKLVNAQKCIRTGDIDDVGDNRHLTFFEMLGNWSLGDYFKKEAIEWSWEFLTDKKYLNLDPKRLYVTVFKGDENSAIDQESINIWLKQFKKANIDAEICSFNTPINGNTDFRIFPLPAKDNWWGPAGTTGPCGPCSEMFYNVDDNIEPLSGTFEQEVNKFRLIEIWNDVFMEFNKLADGRFEKLIQKNVDTGMGLERTLAVLNGKKDAFDTDLFYPIFKKIEDLSKKKYFFTKGDLGYEKMPDCWVRDMRSMRIIADHLKAAVFIIGDNRGVCPSNIDQGYIVRRLIRRAIRYGHQLGITKNLWTVEIAETIINIYKDSYPELVKNHDFITKTLNEEEEEKFAKTLERGLKEFNKIIGVISINEDDDVVVVGSVSTKKINGIEAFDLFQTYGFPIEMTVEIAKEKGIEVDEVGFNEEMKKHQELSRTASAGKFKGGLADSGDETKKLHTATHLLHAALRKVLGNHVQQKGSNITTERLRFDFIHPTKMIPEQLSEVEKIVNDEIKKQIPVICHNELSVEEAKSKGAIGLFESKYGEKIKMYEIGDFSREICGGPHVENTAEIGVFKIIKEESVSAGVRRIKAVIHNMG